MLAGHYAPAYALKRRFPEAPLWALFLAVQAVDVAFFALVGIGAERMRLVPGAEGPLALDLVAMPWTHSLAAAVLYGAATAGLATAAGRPRLGAALALAVASHWFADWLVHLPDLQLAPGLGTRVGLGLWRTPLLGFAVEIGLLAAAFLWLRPALEPGRARRFADATFAAALAIQVANVFVLPPPGSLLELGASAYAVFFGLAMLASGVDRASTRNKMA